MKKTLLIILAFLLLFPTILYAHGIHLILVEPGKFRGEYDGGGFSPRMTVTLYNQKDEILAQGNVDEKGEFVFDPKISFDYAVLEDGMGHRGEYIPEETQKNSITPLKIILPLGIFVGIAFYFQRKTKK
ncbi:hypothetical protein LQU94_00375 [Peptoniphilus sp. KCTC 25270]|uniref:hypothetical protein n=1 Tax=Peptoniphilus sp. KCTC 25270 TaxID=2897414 RepID=UPI001E4FE81F|nr:hypothetical protein [Peptoniphilus sp. KCTC 25270]MCD1146570.1 hypothetical protein [Peptoniphilus sp. KCTC 25270]